MANSANYPQLMTDLQNSVATLLMARKIDPDLAQQIAIDVAEQLSFEWGGSTIYVPKCQESCCSARNNALIAEFNGKNVQALCKKYRFSEQHVYALLRKSKTTKAF